MNEHVVVPFPNRHGAPGYYSLLDGPQQESVTERAFGTEWWELDQIFKFYLGQFVVVTGIAGHGKSTFLLNVLCNVARKQGIRSFLYVPENEGNLKAKMRGIWGETDASFRHFAEFQCFYQSAIPDAYDQQPKTLDWVLNKAAIGVTKDDCDIVLIDPWNELERSKPKDMLMTDHIGESLMTIKQFCRQMNVVVIIVAHPTKSVNENGGRVPGLADIEGSMNWYNKCDNGLIVARDKETNNVRVISAKVREHGAGKLGVCHFHVDADTGIFTPMKGAVTL